MLQETIDVKPDDEQDFGDPVRLQRRHVAARLLLMQETCFKIRSFACLA